MEKKFALLDATIQKQKCYLCWCPLSVPPIDLLKYRDLARCGRCKNVKPLEHFRSPLFEIVAQNFFFPCSYDQCDKRLPWGKVEEHEQNCPHRTMSCPRYHRCGQQVRVDQLLDHFKDKHPTGVITLQSVWRLNKKYDYVFLTKFDNQLFLVYVLDMAVAVLTLQPTKYYKFVVKLLSSTKDNVAVYFENLPIFRYNERLHCYGCVRRNCQQQHHPFAGGYMDFSLFTSSIKKEVIDSMSFSNGDIRYYITLQADEGNSEHFKLPSDEEEDNPLGNTNTQAVKGALKCDHCRKYMEAPIFTCPAGHTICDPCKRYPRCPICAEPIGNCRNYTLEDMAKDIEMPCAFYFKGCPFTGNCANTSTHEQKCPFRKTERHGDTPEG